MAKHIWIDRMAILGFSRLCLYGEGNGGVQVNFGALFLGALVKGELELCIYLIVLLPSSKAYKSRVTAVYIYIIFYGAGRHLPHYHVKDLMQVVV